MPFCHNCGKEVPAGTKFCPECGAQLLSGPRPGGSPKPKTVDTRPAAQKLLALVLLGVGFVTLVLGVLVFVSLSSVYFGFAVFWMGGGLASAAGGYGLWKSAPWMMTGIGVAGAFYLVLGIFLALPGTPGLLGVGALCLALGAFSISWARSSRLRSRFAKS